MKKYWEVEYRTMGGSCHRWNGYAPDESDATSKALNSSFESMCNDDHYHSVVSVYETSPPEQSFGDKLFWTPVGEFFAHDNTIHTKIDDSCAQTIATNVDPTFITLLTLSPKMLDALHVVKLKIEETNQTDDPFFEDIYDEIKNLLDDLS
jgi:hypothetical protein